ncbi:MAG: motility protein MotB, partial [Betaproteobacteria bacterium]|nr:motility protein MotB [Betaproteobacteria bacterium]
VNRANASRRELIAGGLDDNKVLRVVGLASTIPFDRNDPLDPINRRISIVVLNQKTELALLRGDGPEASVVDGDEAGGVLGVRGAGK